MGNEAYLRRLLERLDRPAQPRTSASIIKLRSAGDGPLRPYPLPGEEWQAFVLRMEGEGCTVEGDHEAFIVRLPSGSASPTEARKAHTMSNSQIARRGGPTVVRKAEGGVSSFSAPLRRLTDPAQVSGDGPREAELAAAQKRLDAAERAIGDAAQRLKNSRGHLSDAEATEVVIREQPALYEAFRHAKWARDAVLAKGPLIRV